MSTPGARLRCGPVLARHLPTVASVSYTCRRGLPMRQEPIHTASLSNRRRARRHPVGGQVRAECRRGDLGLGRNLGIRALDISESGVRLVVSAPLSPKEQVEVLLSGPGVPKPLKRLGNVAWTLPLADGGHCIGVSFEKPLRYSELQRFARVV